MRYITIPAPIRIVHPVTEEPLLTPDGKGGSTPEVFSFAKSCRVAIVVVAQKGGADIIALIDLRTKIDQAPVGSTLMLGDDEWALLDAEFRRPNAQAFGGFWAMGGGIAHVRAWLDAPKEKPAVLAEVPADAAAS